MMLKALVLLAIVSCACAVDKSVYKQWKAHIAKYNRKFSTSVESRKSFFNFANALNNVTVHNKEYAAGLKTYKAELNHLSDLGDEDIASITGLITDDSDFNMPFLTKNRKRSVLGQARTPAGYLVEMIGYNPSSDNIKSSVDHSKYVTEVKNQKQCGSCYAHAAASAISANIKKQSGKTFNLSPQQLIDCSHYTKSKFGNRGCNGGIIYNTLDFTHFITTNTFCLATEQEMKYEEAFISSRDCSNDCAKHNQVKCKVVNVKINKEFDLNALKLMIEEGPIFAQLCVDKEFMQYKSGVFKASSSSCNRVNHAVVAVGYGQEGGQEYIKILNSWGDRWGEDGYIKVDPSSIMVSQRGALPVIECDY